MIYKQAKPRSDGRWQLYGVVITHQPSNAIEIALNALTVLSKSFLHPMIDRTLEQTRVFKMCTTPSSQSPYDGFVERASERDYAHLYYLSHASRDLPTDFIDTFF